jgi:sigma-B regulation protein RsbU (phosphoserine phosphatase)
MSDSPEEICTRLNRHLLQVTDESRFATFFYAEWHRSLKLLRYVNAGHHPPVLVGSCGTCRLESGGLPLGVLPDARYTAGEAAFGPGDLLVLFSDGITEAMSPEGEEFGEDRLRQIVEDNAALALDDIQDRILEAINDWTDEEQEDDMTLLIVRATADGEIPK